MAFKQETNEAALTGQKAKTPNHFQVVIHNDDITTMDFVVHVLCSIFHKPAEEAANIMMLVHNSGKGIAGVYVYDIAMTKKMQTERIAREKGFPLKLTLEEAME